MADCSDGNSAHGGFMIGPPPGCAPYLGLADFGLRSVDGVTNADAPRALLGRTAGDLYT